MEKLKRSQKITYSRDFKHKAVMMYKNESMGYKAIAKELGVSSHNVIKRWIEKYDKYGMDGLEEQRGKSCKGRSKATSLTPEEELKKLRAEVELLKKIQALQRG